VTPLGVLPQAIVMRDATDSSELTRLDLADLERNYGFPYMVIHRSDLHRTFLRAAEEHGVRPAHRDGRDGLRPPDPAAGSPGCGGQLRGRQHRRGGDRHRG
jgi:hypothetical protein